MISKNDFHQLKLWLEEKGLYRTFLLIVSGIIMIEIGELFQILYIPLFGILLIVLGIYLVPEIKEMIDNVKIQ